MSGKRRLRPGSASLLAMMVLNGFVSVAVLYVIYALFGLRSILAQQTTHAGEMMHVSAQGVGDAWETLWPLVPGAAIGFALLWFCQVVVGRTRGVGWNVAFFYGIGIALGNVLLAGLISGSLNGSPLIGLLLGLLMLMMVPSNVAGMVIFGAVMGLFNARLAQGWITRYYPRP
ncbi:MAG: hypothetical protein JWN14_3470 [Chthonomonadales bacterium]|nr:hypothetical protein [Chthonomonadales bacterium]